MPVVDHRTRRLDGTQFNNEQLYDSAAGRLSGLESGGLRLRALAARSVDVLWLTAHPDPAGRSGLRSLP